MPPSVCLVLEICAFGSLSDVLRGISVASAGTMKARFPFNLSTADRMFLALGCAKGLAALHNYSAIPGLCHRDIKSYNFLIDDQLNSKIADLELGSFDFKSTSKSKTSENDQRKYRDNIGMNITWQAPEV
jgi:serine/threonine protein kinase